MERERGGESFLIFTGLTLIPAMYYQTDARFLLKNAIKHFFVGSRRSEDKKSFFSRVIDREICTVDRKRFNNLLDLFCGSL